MTPDEFRAQFMKTRGMAPPVPGVTLGSTPVQPSPVINPNDPVRMPSQEAVDAWRRGVTNDIQSGVIPNPAATVAPVVAAPPVRPPSAFPAGGAPAVPFSRPAVESGPAGLTLNSAPAPGFAGTVGQEIPGAPAAKDPSLADALSNKDVQKMFDSIGDLVKKPKISPEQAAAAATINPSSLQPNAPSQMAGQLMAALLQGKRNQGLTLTGY